MLLHIVAYFFLSEKISIKLGSGLCGPLVGTWQVYGTFIAVILHLCSFIVSKSETVGLFLFEKLILQTRIWPSAPPDIIFLIKKYILDKKLWFQDILSLRLYPY